MKPSPAAGQVVAAEAALLLVAATWPVGWWVRGVTVTVLLATVCTVGGRYRSRWVYAWAGVGRAYRARRRTRSPDGSTAPGGAGGPPAGTEVGAFVDRSGTRFGVVSDGRSLTTLLVVEPAQAATVASAGEDVVDLGVLAGALSHADVRLASVHVVVRTVPAPSRRVDVRSPVATSYEEIRAGAQAHRAVVVSLRLEPALCVPAVLARGGGELGSRRALASVTARLVARLGPGLRVRVLGPDEVRAAVSAGLGAPAGPVTETWTGLRSPSGLSHVCFRLTSWGVGGPARVVAGLSGVPATSTALGLTLTAGSDDGVDVRAVLRVVSLAEDVDVDTAAVAAAARQAGADVARCDGEHATALAQTLPAGGLVPVTAAARGDLARVVPEWLAALEVPLDPGGLVLGRSTGGQPLVAKLFRDRPVSGCAVLDPRVVMVVCFRALAVGATIDVVSTRADLWLPLRRLGIDDPAVVSISSPETAVAASAPARADRPRLVVIDLPDRPDVPPVVGQPWQAVLTVLPDLSTRHLPSARASALTLLRRLTRAEAMLAAPFLGLPPGSREQLSLLGDEQVSAVERGRAEVVDLALSAAESRLVVAVTSAPVASSADPTHPRVRP